MSLKVVSVIVLFLSVAYLKFLHYNSFSGYVLGSQNTGSMVLNQSSLQQSLQWSSTVKHSARWKTHSESSLSSPCWMFLWLMHHSYSYGFLIIDGEDYVKLDLDTYCFQMTDAPFVCQSIKREKYWESCQNVGIVSIFLALMYGLGNSLPAQYAVFQYRTPTRQCLPGQLPQPRLNLLIVLRLHSSILSNGWFRLLLVGKVTLATKCIPIPLPPNWILEVQEKHLLDQHRKQFWFGSFLFWPIFVPFTALEWQNHDLYKFLAVQYQQILFILWGRIL